VEYRFRVVPLDELQTYSAILETFDAPVDHHHALQLGACCLVVIRSAQNCLSGIAQEKRELACWVRDQRASVRSLRYKGASKHRAAANAEISNAADRARNTLDWLRHHAPSCAKFARGKMAVALQHVNIDEAEGYLPTYIEEVGTAIRAANRKRLMFWFIGLGLLFLYLYYPAGLLLLGCALLIFLLNRKSWKEIADAKKMRQQQFLEINLKRQEEELYDLQLDQKPVEDESIEQSVKAIARQLKGQYQFLDIACRDINSKALSWEQLAAEVMADMNDDI